MMNLRKDKNEEDDGNFMYFFNFHNNLLHFPNLVRGWVFPFFPIDIFCKFRCRLCNQWLVILTHQVKYKILFETCCIS